MITIDHRFFPHIIDAIWQVMPVASAAVARSVSRAWRTRANAVLQRHVHASPEGNGIRVAVVNPDKPERRWDPECPGWYIDPKVAERMAYWHDETPPDAEEWGELYGNIKYIDLEGWDVGHNVFERPAVCALLDALSWDYPMRLARVLLDRNSKDVHPEAHEKTTVFFGIEQYCTEIHLKDCTDLVLNLGFLPWDSSDPDGSSLRQLPMWDWLTVDGGPRRLRNLVLIFDPRDAPDAGAIKVEKYCSKRARYVTYYLDVPAAPTTLVGLEGFCANMHWYNTLKTKLLDLVSSARARFGSSEGTGTLQVLTHAEYKALV